MLEVTFIGTSGSTPTIERGMPAITLKYGPELLLFDCGEGTQRQMMKYRVGFGSISAIFITHAHLDHYVGLFGLLETLNLSSPSPKRLSLFVPPQLAGAFEGRYGFVEIRPIKKGVLYEGKGFRVSAFPVKHFRGAFGFAFEEEARRKFHEQKAKGLGIKGRQFSEIQKKGSIIIDKKKITLDEVTWTKPGRKIVYSGDCPYCDSTVEAAKNADLLIHEATFDASKKEEARERMHSTVEDAARAARDAGAKRLALVHISPRYSDEINSLLEAARKIFPDTVAAEDGMKISL